jgi:hypothetical protein
MEVYGKFERNSIEKEMHYEGAESKSGSQCR